MIPSLRDRIVSWVHRGCLERERQLIDGYDDLATPIVVTTKYIAPGVIVTELRGVRSVAGHEKDRHNDEVVTLSGDFHYPQAGGS